MLIREAQKKDLPECEQLVHIPEMRMPSGEFFDQAFLENYLDDNCFLVAEDKTNKIVGLIAGEPVKAGGLVIWMIAVLDSVRGQGIGSRLMEEYEKRARKNGRKWLLLYAYQENPQVLDFYQKHGFSRGAKTIEFAKDLK